MYGVNGIYPGDIIYFAHYSSGYNRTTFNKRFMIVSHFSHFGAYVRITGYTQDNEKICMTYDPEDVFSILRLSPKFHTWITHEIFFYIANVDNKECELPF